MWICLSNVPDSRLPKEGFAPVSYTHLKQELIEEEELRKKDAEAAAKAETERKQREEEERKQRELEIQQKEHEPQQKAESSIQSAQMNSCLLYTSIGVPIFLL